MSVAPATLLSQLEDAISALQVTIANHAVQEYYIGSRRIRRAEFGRTLDSLYRQRDQLKREISAGAGRRVRVAKFGGARAVDR